MIIIFFIFNFALPYKALLVVVVQDELSKEHKGKHFFNNIFLEFNSDMLLLFEQVQEPSVETREENEMDYNSVSTEPVDLWM